MTPDRILLDTDVVIHLLRGHKGIQDRVAAANRAGAELMLSPVVVAEVLAGAFPREMPMIEALFSFFSPVHLTIEDGRFAGAYASVFRRSHSGISFEDLLIAGTARRLGAVLWTGNRKHYPMTDIAFLDA